MPSRTRTAAAALGHHEERYWPADPTAPTGGQRGGTYEVFIPDRIADREFALDSGAVAVIAEATKALGHLNDTRPRLASLAALARNLLRSESAASSRIEGVKISHKRLARAAYARVGSRQGDNRAAEVLGNVEAMERAIELGASVEPFSVTGSRVGSAAMTTTLWVRHMSVLRTSCSPSFWTIFAASSRVPTSRRLRRRRSRMLSSRTSIRSWMGTGAPGVR